MAHTDRQRVPLPLRNHLDTGIYNRGSNSRPRATQPKHDSLHMQDGLTNCWCRCAACWDQVQGKCVCLSCPCSRGRV